MARKREKSKGCKPALLHNDATQGDEQMAVPGLSRRGSVWQFRVRVPKNLQKAIGKVEIVKSLGRSSHADAAQRARQMRVAADKLFAAAKEQLQEAPQPHLSEPLISESKLRHLARVFFSRLEKNAEPVPLREEDRDQKIETVRELWAEISHSVENASFQKIAWEFVERENINIERNSVAFIEICEIVQRAHIEHCRRENDRLQLLQEVRRDPLFVDIDKFNAPIAPLMLGEAVDRFKKEPHRAAHPPKTQALRAGRLAAWLDLLGTERPVKNISKNEVRDALKLLSAVPKNAAKLFPGTPLRKVVKEAEREGLPLLSVKTVQLYLNELNALFISLVDDGDLSRNPIQNLKSAPSTDEVVRRPWTIDELNKLFTCTPFDRPWYPGRNKSWLYWLPLLGLYTGARQGELGGLHGGDLVSIEDRWFLSIQPNEVRRLKTKQSRRIIPVHPMLQRLGFIEFARSRAATEMLFSDIPETVGGPLTVIQKGLGRHIRSLIEDETVVFHSLRHSFRDAAREAELPLEVAGAIARMERRSQVVNGWLRQGLPRKDLGRMDGEGELSGSEARSPRSL